MNQTSPLRARVRSFLLLLSLTQHPRGAGAEPEAATGHLPSTPPPFGKLLGLQRARPGLGRMLPAFFTIHRPPQGGLRKRARSCVGTSGGKRPWCNISRSRLPQGYTPMDCSLPGSSVSGISQARILEWVARSEGKLAEEGLGWGRHLEGGEAKD